MGHHARQILVSDPMDRYRAIAESNRKSLTKGSSVFCAGDPNKGLFLVLDGIMEIHGPNRFGEMILGHLYWPNQWIGAEAALTAGFHYMSASARTHLEIGILSPSTLGRLARSSPAIWRDIGCLAAEDQRLTCRAWLDATIRDPKHRIIATLLRLTEGVADETSPCTVPVTQAELATMTNLCRNTAAKLLSDMADEGLIAAGYRGITITSFIRMRERLEAFDE
jgi:CRP-like cAMP-binding protein